jgi:hypothetical protein
MRSRRYFKKLTRLIRIFCIGSHWDAQYTTHEVLGYIHKSDHIYFVDKWKQVKAGAEAFVR